MTTHEVKSLLHQTAAQHLIALIRKYNQASVNTVGNVLTIYIDDEQPLKCIAYTLQLRHPSDKAWEIRRVNTSLEIPKKLQSDFIAMTMYMETNLSYLRL